MGAAGLLTTAVFTALGGVVAYLAGVAGLGEARRLERVGVTATALVKHRPMGDPAAAARPLLQFSTRDGLVMEVFSPVPSSRSFPLTDGRRVLIAYDPADPRQVLVRGRERRRLEFAFLALGGTAVLAALTLVSLSA